MKKRIITVILVVAILAGHLVSLVSAAESEYSKKYITIDFYGKKSEVKVFVNKDGKILMPIHLLGSLTGMERKTTSSKHIFYYESQKAATRFKKEIHIYTNGNRGDSVCYTASNQYVPLASVTFTDSYTDLNTLYLPIEEFLPFFDAKIEITDDGILHIYPNPVSLYVALTAGPCQNIDWYTYDPSEDICAYYAVGVLGSVIDSFWNGFRFDRLDLATHSGAIKDYSEIFKDLLTSNETYLAAFDKSETPFEEALGAISDSLDNFDENVGRVKDIYDAMAYLTESDESFKPFSENVKAIGEASKVIGGIHKVASFSKAYLDQVEDHRNMLNAVYNGNYCSSSVAAEEAANEVYSLYGANTMNSLTSATVSVLRDYIVKTGTGALTSSIKPFNMARDAAKLAVNWVYPDSISAMGDLSKVFYLDTIIEDAENAYNMYKNSTSFDEDTLENMRLSLIMALLSSKYAYEMYTMDEDSIKQIDDWLEKLYLAADSVEYSSKESYSIQKAALEKSIKHLKLTSKGTGSDETEDTKETEVQPESEWPKTGECGDRGDNVIWKFYENGKLVISGNGDMADYWDYQSTPWYPYLLDIETIVIERGVTSIGDSAFDLCGNCKSVSIPDSITSIGARAFYTCMGITSITIPDSVTSIGAYAFSECQYLYSVDLPDSITKIEDGLFSNCISLDYITIPSGVTSIGNYAFFNCYLFDINIPASVISIGDGAFSGCDHVSTINVDSDNNKYHSDGNCLIETKSKLLVSGTINSIIPQDGSVTSIGNGAFQGLTDLTNITIPYGITSIGECAFEYCYSLESITIPDSVISIGESAFEECTSLVTVTIPDSVTHIDNYAFLNCDSLTTVYIPDSITSFGLAVFSVCNSLTDIYYEGTESEWIALNINNKNHNSNYTVHYNSKK